MADRPLLPFRRFTRQRRSIVGSAQTGALNQTLTFTLNRVGLLNYLFLRVTGTVNLSAAGALADLGPWSLIDRVRVDMNLGNMNIVDIDGYRLYQMNKVWQRGWAPNGGPGNYTPNTNVYSAGVANGNNTWTLGLMIPISLNPGSQFDSGMINMQAPEVQVTVTVRLASAGSAFVTNFNSLSNCSVELHQCYFDLPDPRAVMLPPGQVVRTTQFTLPIVSTGLNLYTVDRQGKALQFITTLRANNARTDGFDKITLIANINDYVYDQTLGFVKTINEMDYSNPSDVGTAVIDLWHATENPSSGDARDVINTERLTTLQIGTTVSSSTILGSGNNFFDVVTRRLVDFAMPGVGASV